MDARQQFISVMRRVAHSVTVVTTDGPHGMAGLTVSAMCSLSADPPSLVVCVNRSGRSHASLVGNGVFCVNLLNAGQSRIADRFADRLALPERKFDHGDWGMTTSGCPKLRDAAAWFDCGLDSLTPFGTHDVMIGRVVESSIGNGDPLLYANQAYASVRPAKISGPDDAAPTNSRPPG